MKNLIKLFLSITLGIILIIIFIKIIDINILFEHIKKVNIYYIFPALFFYLLSYFIRSLRLRNLLSHIKLVPVIKNYSYILARNLINYLIPIGAGDITKSVLYKNNHNIKYSESLPSIFMDKLLDTFVIIIVLLLIPFINISFNKELFILLILLIGIFLLGILILLVTSISENFVTNFLQRFIFLVPKQFKKKVYEFIKLFVKGLAIFKHKKRILFKSISLTFLSTFSDSLFFFLMFTAFGVKINFIQILFGYTLIFLSYALPIHPPGQIGTNEWIMILIFSIGFSIDINLTAAIMALSHLLTAIVIFITGFISLTYAGLRIIDVFNNKEITNG